MSLKDLLTKENAVVGYGRNPEEAVTQARAALPFPQGNRYSLYRESKVTCVSCDLNDEGKIVETYQVRIAFKVAPQTSQGESLLSKARSVLRGPGAAPSPDFGKYERI